MEWMDRERKFWLVGGDRRQQALARLLEEDGHTVHVTALEGEGLRPEPLGAGPLRAAAAASDPGKGSAAHSVEQGNTAVGDTAGGPGAGADPLRRSGFSLCAPGGGETGPTGL